MFVHIYMAVNVYSSKHAAPHMDKRHEPACLEGKCATHMYMRNVPHTCIRDVCHTHAYKTCATHMYKRYVPHTCVRDLCHTPVHVPICVQETCATHMYMYALRHRNAARCTHNPLSHTSSLPHPLSYDSKGAVPHLY